MGSLAYKTGLKSQEPPSLATGTVVQKPPDAE
jgi:hypothetical protein